MMQGMDAMTYRDDYPRSISPNYDVHTIASLTRLEEGQHRILRAVDRVEEKVKPKIIDNRRFPTWASPTLVVSSLVSMGAIFTHLNIDKLKSFLEGLVKILDAFSK